MLSFISGSFSMQFFFIDAMSDKNSKFYFTPEERDVFIDFVRENTILYRNKNKGARDVKEKNRLWKQIASQINKKPEICKKKWYMMRDGFWRYMSKSAGKSESEIRYNQKSLMFLLESPTELAPEIITADMQIGCDDVKVQFDETAAAINYFQNVASASNHFAHFIGSSQPVTDDLLTSFEHMQEGETMPSKYCQTDPETDNLEVFFGSLANTMKTFPKIEIAKLKLEMCKMVGQKEIELNSPVQ